jgi:hypothetical protein
MNSNYIKKAPNSPQSLVYHGSGASSGMQGQNHSLATGISLGTVSVAVSGHSYNNNNNICKSQHEVSTPTIPFGSPNDSYLLAELLPVGAGGNGAIPFSLESNSSFLSMHAMQHSGNNSNHNGNFNGSSNHDNGLSATSIAGGYAAGAGTGSGASTPALHSNPLGSPPFRPSAPGLTPLITPVGTPRSHSHMHSNVSVFSLGERQNSLISAGNVLNQHNGGSGPSGLSVALANVNGNGNGNGILQPGCPNNVSASLMSATTSATADAAHTRHLGFHVPLNPLHHSQSQSHQIQNQNQSAR